MQRMIQRLAILSPLFWPLSSTFVGGVLVLTGLYILILWLYRSSTLPAIYTTLSLSFLPPPLRITLFLIAGAALFTFGIWRLTGTLALHLNNENLTGDEMVLGYFRKRQPPRVVVLSGGAGMLMLSSLGEHVERLTCIPPIHDPIEYYYRASSLFDFENVYYVVPSPIPANVIARLDNDVTMNVMHVNPNSELAQRHVVDLQLETHQQTSTEDSTQITLPLTRMTQEALRDAEAIVLGPGSLFESVVPNLLIDELRTAIQESNARKIYICNLMTEPGLTTGFGVGDHIRQIKRYGGFTPDYVLLNIQRIEPEVRQIYAAEHQAPVLLTPEECDETTVLTREGVPHSRVVVENSIVIESDLATSVVQYSTSLSSPDEKRAIRVLRHDPQKLASAILELLRRETESL